MGITEIVAVVVCCRHQLSYGIPLGVHVGDVTCSAWLVCMMNHQILTHAISKHLSFSLLYIKNYAFYYNLTQINDIDIYFEF